MSHKNVASSIYSSLMVIANAWNLKNFVIAGLLSQTLLLFLAPFRKKTSNSVFLAFVWFAYIYSDWGSNFAVGLIPTSKDQPSSKPGSDLLMFWAPFLLLHIGGTDPIAALNSTDNELWSRFAIQLATMTYGIGSAFYRSFLESSLRVPMLLLFVAGLTKFIERLLSFHGARFSSLKESILEERTKKAVGKPLDLDCRKFSQLSDAKMVSDASRLFKSFTPLFVDLEVESSDRKKSREYFQGRNSKDAFRVVEIELNLSYDLFYTKGVVIRQGLGRFLRPVCMICEVAALVLWLQIDKHNFKRQEANFTYTLLIGAVARDFISLLMIVFSDSSTAIMARNSDDSKLSNWWLSLRKQRWGSYSSSKEAPFLIRMSRALLRRWCESIWQLNFIDLCFPGKLPAYRNGIDSLFKFMPVAKKWFSNDLKDFIYREFLGRVDQDKTGLSRGQCTLTSYGPEKEDLLNLSRKYVEERTFDESLPMWHIATTICYHTENEESLEESEKQSREISRVLSDYMFYLLLQNSDMMLQFAAAGTLRHDDTLCDAERFFEWLTVRNRERTTVIEGCRGLLTEIPDGGELRVFESSVLIDSSRLARDLKKCGEVGGVKMWELIAKVWVEMLGYAAFKCSPSAHAAQLATGGELLTLVWLLMEHIGFDKKEI